LLPDHAERVDSVAWANDNKTIFYTVEDEVSKRSYRLYRHNVGTSGPDGMIYEEKDERFDVGTGKTRSKAYLLLISGSHTTSEARYIPADQPMAEMESGWNLANRTSSTTRTTMAVYFYIRVKRHGPQFPPGQGAGLGSRQQKLARGRAPSRQCHAR